MPLVRPDPALRAMFIGSAVLMVVAAVGFVVLLLRGSGLVSVWVPALLVITFGMLAASYWIQYRRPRE